MGLWLHTLWQSHLHIENCHCLLDDIQLKTSSCIYHIQYQGFPHASHGHVSSPEGSRHLRLGLWNRFCFLDLPSPMRFVLTLADMSNALLTLSNIHLQQKWDSDELPSPMRFHLHPAYYSICWWLSVKVHRETHDVCLVCCVLPRCFQTSLRPGSEGVANQVAPR